MSLPNEINTATRSLHTRLNALITSRLPLVIPPHSSTPDVYLTGILPFAQVFIAFEKAWDTVSTKSPTTNHAPEAEDVWVDVPLQSNGESFSSGCQPEYKNSDGSKANMIDPTLLSHLKSLRPGGLARANRLRRDIACLAGIPLDDVDSYLTDHAADASILFLRHIAAVVEEKPHVLLAYAFVMYMAVFSGGRWIRSVLASPGAAFWSSTEMLGQQSGLSGLETAHAASGAHEKIRTFNKEEQQVLEAAGLSFWFWSGLADGLDIKADFKAQLDIINGLLTDHMREDIVAEAREIFIRCEGLVGELDERVGRQGQILKSIITIEQQEYEAEKAARTVNLSQFPVSQRRLFQLPHSSWPDWMQSPGYTGWALVFSCISWYALYHAGAFGNDL